MTALWFTHDDCLHHVTPPGHPERVDRARAVTKALQEVGGLSRRAAPLGQDADILRAHPQSYLDRVLAAEPAEGWAQLDADTFISPGSMAAARRAVGGAVAAVDAVMSREAATALIACRPPGHHAERDKAMGFCLFGTAAIAAKRALDHHGAGRVAVLDFDVHHGNGTQDILWDDARALFCSTHQMPLFPGTGAESERGAHGNVHNHPLRPSSGGREAREVWGDAILPVVAAFEPELIVVSAGFDAHEDDPLAGLNWSVEDFRWITSAICGLAQEICGGRVVSTLEGGYDLDALGASVAAHADVLKEHAS